MKKKILKFKLLGRESGDCFDMPIGSGIMTIQALAGIPWLWILADEQAETEQRVFKLFSTDAIIDINEFHYIGTYNRYGGQFVHHLFEKSKTNNNNVK